MCWNLPMIRRLFSCSDPPNGFGPMPVHGCAHHLCVITVTLDMAPFLNLRKKRTYQNATAFKRSFHRLYQEHILPYFL